MSSSGTPQIQIKPKRLPHGPPYGPPYGPPHGPPRKPALGTTSPRERPPPAITCLTIV